MVLAMRSWFSRWSRVRGCQDLVWSESLGSRAQISQVALGAVFIIVRTASTTPWLPVRVAAPQSAAKLQRPQAAGRMAEESELVVAGEVVAEVMEREAPSTGEAVGSVEYLGRWHEKRRPGLCQRDERAMPVKMKTVGDKRAYARIALGRLVDCLLYTSPSPRDRQKSRMPSSA